MLASRRVAGARGQNGNALVGVEAQALGADEHHVAGEAHLTHREGRIVAREHDEAHLLGEADQEIVEHAIEPRRLGRLLIVVEDDVHLQIERGITVADEHGLHVLDREGGLGGGPEAIEEPVTESGTCVLNAP